MTIGDNGFAALMLFASLRGEYQKSLKLFPQAQVVQALMKVLNLEAKLNLLSKISGVENGADVVIVQK